MWQHHRHNSVNTPCIWVLQRWSRKCRLVLISFSFLVAITIKVVKPEMCMPSTSEPWHDMVLICLKVAKILQLESDEDEQQQRLPSYEISWNSDYLRSPPNRGSNKKKMTERSGIFPHNTSTWTDFHTWHKPNCLTGCVCVPDGINGWTGTYQLDSCVPESIWSRIDFRLPKG